MHKTVEITGNDILSNVSELVDYMTEYNVINLIIGDIASIEELILHFKGNIFKAKTFNTISPMHMPSEKYIFEWLDFVDKSYPIIIFDPYCKIGAWRPKQDGVLKINNLRKYAIDQNVPIVIIQSARKNDAPMAVCQELMYMASRTLIAKHQDDSILVNIDKDVYESTK